VTRRVRVGLFLAGGAGLALLLAWGLAGLPDFGHYAGPYGDILVKVAKPQRHIANVVTAVVFDYRGFDTMGEELILLAAVCGTAVLLREVREHDVSGVVDEVSSDALRASSLVAVPAVFVLSLYVIAHGPLTPGGGFQGGVVASATLLLLFLGVDYRSFHRVGHSSVWDSVEGVGAAGFVGLGLLSLALGLAFLENFLPLGTFGRLTSTGSIALVNWAAALAVSAGFVLIYGEYLQEAMAIRHGKFAP
jgi:multicomponent Na+:H+ antiporter subunit B